MDFIVFSALKRGGNAHVVSSYDIACQWSKNLKRRMERYPPCISFDQGNTIDVVIPKFHLQAHGASCQTVFSFNFLPGSGRMCGELVETDWGIHNILGASTREMSPASRHETLNDHWSNWNWRKVTNLSMFSLSHTFEHTYYSFRKASS
jgi:hypothetical protein